MSEPDFSGINPLRVPTARKRLAAIQEYLAIPNRTTQDKIRVAESIGLSRWAFQRLVKAWIQYKRVDLLVENKKVRETKKLSVSARVRAILQEEVARAGPEASLSTVTPAIQRRCEAEGLKMPSAGTIYNHIKRARAETPGMIGGPPRIAIGRLSFRLPVKAEMSEAIANHMPQTLVAVALPECFVLHHVISVDADRPPSIELLVEKLLEGQTLDGEQRSVQIEAMDLQLTRPIFERFGISKSGRNGRSTQKELSRAFGEKFGSLVPVYTPNRGRPARKSVLTRQDEPLTEADAVAAIEAAIAANNLSRLIAKPSYTIASKG